MQTNYKIAVRTKTLADPVCVVVGMDDASRRMVDSLNVSMDTLLLYSDSTDSIMNAIRNFKSLRVIVFSLNSKFFPILLLDQLKLNFPNIPVVASIPDCLDALELARSCGERGVSKIVNKRNLRELNTYVQELSQKTRIRIEDFDVNLDTCTPLTRNAIQIIGDNYIELMSSREIAAKLSISESALSREFKKSDLCGPKRLLMYFKVKHAMTLMQNFGYNISEVAFKSGFSNEKRFNECVVRVFGKSPKEVRKNLPVYESQIEDLS